MTRQENLEIRYELAREGIYISNRVKEFYDGERLIEKIEKIANIVLRNSFPHIKRELLSKCGPAKFSIDDLDAVFVSLTTPKDPKVEAIKEILSAEGISFSDQVIHKIIAEARKGE